MTDGIDGSIGAVSETASVQPAPQPAQAEAAKDERVFRQPEVNDIVRRAKHDAVEAYRRQATEQPQYVQQKYGDTQTPLQSHTLSPDDVKRMAAEEFQRAMEAHRESERRTAQEQDAQRIATEFFGKLNAGKEKYSDFDSVVGNVNFQKFPNAVQLATRYAENTADVMYELGKDRTRLAQLEWLSERSPEDAIVQFQRFAQSVKENADARNARTPNAPLSQLKPSPGVESGGAAAVTSLRRDPRFRV